MVVPASRKPGLEMTSKTIPQRMATSAAMICPASLIQGLSVRMSSSAPITAMMTAPSSRPMTVVDMLTTSSDDTTKPKKIASPPMRGIGWMLMRRSLGSSMAPTFSANRLTWGVIRKQSTKAAIGPSSIFQIGTEACIISLRTQNHPGSGTHSEIPPPGLRRSG